MVEAFRNAGDASGTRVFFPASAIAGEAVPRGLESLGATVHRVTAYRMVKLPLNAVQCRIALEKGEVRAVTFASPSAMEGLREGLGDELFRQLAADVPAAAMGPTTAGALKAGGWRRIRVAVDATLEGLAEAALEAGRKN
jgi:uroporphyrinogen-III synthase